MIRSYIIVSFFCAVSFGVEAQSNKERYQRILSKYTQLESANIEISIKLKAGENRSDLLYDAHAEVRKHGENYHYIFGEIEMLMNARYLIVVDKSAKEIMCSSRSEKLEKRFMKQNSLINIDSLLGSMIEPSVTEEGTNSIFHFDNSKGEIERIEIMVDSSDNLRQIVYRYRKGEIAVITFDLFDVSPAFSQSAFDESRYFRTVNSRKQLMKEYLGYALVFVN